LPKAAATDEKSTAAASGDGAVRWWSRAAPPALGALCRCTWFRVRVRVRVRVRLGLGLG